MRSCNVLIVDDEKLNQIVLTQTLAPFYQVACVDNAQQMFDFLTKNTPDLILLDLMMPGIDGFEALQQLKANSQTQDIPIIIISASENQGAEERGFDLGANDYISKPFSQTVVQARVKNQLLIKQKSDLLERLASIDGLTEIPNRRYMAEHLSKEWRRSIRSGTPLSIVLIDVDYFKQYNDIYGHQKGDECLKTIAKALSTNCQRGGDFVARYGGEEFIAVLPNSEETTALALANKLKTIVEQLNIEHTGSQIANYVTASFGVATFNQSTLTTECELITRADEALYKAKERGRNTVVLCP